MLTTKRSGRRAALLAATVVAVACTSPAGSPRAAAEGFLDAHYVRIDLPAARPFCAGLALEKLEREITLVQEGAEAVASERPRVTYRLEEERAAGERAQYAYELAIHPTGTDPFHKIVVVSLQKEAGGWRVSNYSESDR